MPRNDRTPSPAGEDELYEVEKIKDHRIEEKKGVVRVEFKIRWKGYAPEDDTWEPRDTLIDGAEGVLKAYIDKQAAKGVTIPEDGPRRKSKARASEAAPPSVDSSSNKRKKKESLAAEPEEEERPRKKKEKVPEPIDLSPDPEPVPTKPHKSRKSQAAEEAAPEDPPAAPASRPSSSKKKREEVPTAPEVERVASQAATSKAEPSAKRFDAVVVEVPEITGSHVHRHAASWETLAVIETLENDDRKPGTYRWSVSWPSDGLGQEWLSNEVARRKMPQRLLDFYEQNLRFRTPSETVDEMEQ